MNYNKVKYLKSRGKNEMISSIFSIESNLIIFFF